MPAAEPPAPEAPAPEPPAAPSLPIAPPAAPPRQERAPLPAPDLPDAPDAEAAPPADAAISLDELGRRIKQTPAIGTFTKLALKNDIDDLVEELRGYHDRGAGSLDPLHERYEALVLKLLALLETEEPALAQDLARSREDIWKRLADPVEFAQLSS